MAGVAYADVPVAQRQEVDHLLVFIANSGCVINRNGTDYPAAKGVEHINNKYDYFRGDINSTEDFIALTATKSTMSGKYYEVKCPGSERTTTQAWLQSELKKYREKQ
jgi:hypothetical protein